MTAAGVLGGQLRHARAGPQRRSCAVLCCALQDEVAVPSVEAPGIPPPAPSNGQQQQEQPVLAVLRGVADSTTGPAQGMDPIALVDLGSRAFSILADVAAGMFSTQPWAQHLQQRSAMVGLSWNWSCKKCCPACAAAGWLTGSAHNSPAHSTNSAAACLSMASRCHGVCAVSSILYGLLST